MTKRIDGRRYDTDKAEQIGITRLKVFSVNSFMITNLYKKKTGEFFIVCIGQRGCGSLADYIEPLSFPGGVISQLVIPISITQAMHYVNDFFPNEFERLFGKRAFLPH